MKGTVVSTWMKSCRRVYGDAVVDAAIEANHLPKNKVFSPLEDIDDNVALGIIATIARLSNIEVKELWYFVGLENIQSFATDYSGFFKRDNAYQFLKSMNDVHVIVMKRFQGAKPPLLDVEPISSRSAYITYRSKRGMFDYFRGLIDGVAKHFDETILVEQIAKEEHSLKLKLTFEKPIRKNQWYWFNALFSFGIVRLVGIKTAIINALVMGAAGLYLGWNELPQLMLVAFVSTAIVASIVNIPLLSIIQDVKRLKRRNFADMINIKSFDNYSKVNKEINELKSNVQKDFIGFNAVVDEMGTFSQSVSGISKSMNEVSHDISRIVKELADGAMAQAEDTEKSIIILNDNLHGINQISSDERVNQGLIEEAVVTIDQSFHDVKTTADKISEMMIQFSGLRDDGNHLKHQADNILSIVSVVSKISQQTSLLSLNASVEAARAGQAGKGFAVVAEEVRSLASETKNAVASIDENLLGIVSMIQTFVLSIEKQYGILERESKILATAVDTTNTSNVRIKDVALRMGETTNRLARQTESINTLFARMESLSAIAQENSASSEETSANVEIYTQQIKDLTEQIHIFEKMIGNFKQDLGKYKV